MSKTSIRDISRAEFCVESIEGKKFSLDQIKVSALLRIADATELMAKNHSDMQSDLDYLKKKYHNALLENSQLKKITANQQSQLTKKNKEHGSLQS
jgi:hypothetical protein